MPRFRFALLGLFLLVVQPLLAKTYYVGSCKTGAYPTIGAAVAAVPAGSTIDVCPGTYPEQVVISQPLTLQGFASAGSSQAVIAMPSIGLATTSSISLGGTVAAQLEVTAGPVNITGITVDGTAGASNCPGGYHLGIFYASGSTGTVNEVETRSQNCNTSGIGILAENGADTSTSVTIENSDVNNNSWAGIYACSPQSPSTLIANIKSNAVESIGYGIDSDCNVAGSVSSNFVHVSSGGPLGGGGFGIVANSPSSTISANVIVAANVGILAEAIGGKVSGNTITGGNDGIVVESAAVVISNRIANTTYDGIYLANPGATVETNFITQTPVGIEFNCLTGTVSGNSINGAATGFDEFPGTSTGTNKFYSVATLTAGCAGDRK